jgi:hypothetical protein
MGAMTYVYPVSGFPLWSVSCARAEPCLQSIFTVSGVDEQW